MDFMARHNPEIRERLVSTAAKMLRRGSSAVSIRELAKEANAPLGSTYHYFPNGKKQVITEAIQMTGEQFSQMLESALKKDPRAGVTSLLNLWKEVILNSNYNAGCPIIAVAMEDSNEADIEMAQQEAAKVFIRWRDLMSASFVAHGASEEVSNRLALTVIAAAEGAIAMCRVLRDIEPFEETTQQLNLLLSENLNI